MGIVQTTPFRLICARMLFSFRHWTRLCSVSGIFLLLAGFLQAQDAPSVINPKLMNAELLARGREVYENNCVGCHGTKGDGQGPAADRLTPMPRDFTAGTFKFRSTPTGSLPTDEDLFRTIRQGLYGSAMPSYRFMPDRDVLSVIQYIKTFSDIWTDPSNYAAPMPIPYPPDWFKNSDQVLEHSKKGRAIYVQYCLSCHGDKADGHGPSSATLEDKWERPIKPADLRKSYIRSGRTLTDIYKVLVTGVAGAPMPSYAESTTPEQRWDLIAYIQQLRTEHYQETHSN